MDNLFLYAAEGPQATVTAVTKVPLADLPFVCLSAHVAFCLLRRLRRVEGLPSFAFITEMVENFSERTIIILTMVTAGIVVFNVAFAVESHEGI